MTQMKSSAYPQDNDSGMLVATQKGDKIDWQTDPFMHFECVQSKSVYRSRPQVKLNKIMSIKLWTFSCQSVLTYALFK